jgi:hypothetical protein
VILDARDVLLCEARAIPTSWRSVLRKLLAAHNWELEVTLRIGIAFGVQATAAIHFDSSRLRKGHAFIHNDFSRQKYRS